APTERGTKHLRELTRAVSEGFQAAVCFVVQMDDMRWLEPNDATDPAFGRALREAAQAGVEVHAYCCRVTPDSLTISREIPVKL
ncbi:MAG: DNA/RNA nuclease SfsA, partial [Oscillospiraceae bacterium]|nr:DNA/RNA nuclease SfsA [Oscillospiraceae bacterium]